MKLSLVCTVHKVQGFTLSKEDVSFVLQKLKLFKPVRMYVALSIVKTFQYLFCMIFSIVILLTLFLLGFWGRLKTKERVGWGGRQIRLSLFNFWSGLGFTIKLCMCIALLFICHLRGFFFCFFDVIVFKARCGKLVHFRIIYILLKYLT